MLELHGFISARKIHASIASICEQGATKAAWNAVQKAIKLCIDHYGKGQKYSFFSKLWRLNRGNLAISFLFNTIEVCTELSISAQNT